MRVLLITVSEMLPFDFIKVLNPALEYCAIVVDEPEQAKKILAKTPLKDIVHPFYELKELAETFYYDCAISISNEVNGDLVNAVKKYGVPQNKLVDFSGAETAANYLLEKALRYYGEHSAEFEIFSTGLSYVQDGIKPEQFKRKLFNFGRGSQDLYYDCQIAKYVLKKSGGGRHIKYALIGLAPYSFHYDASKVYGAGNLAQYAVALNDVHNFWLPIEKYTTLLNPAYLNTKFECPPYLNCISYVGSTVNHITAGERFKALDRFDEWKSKNYPETIKENVKILDDYLKLCEENNVRAIIFLPPMTYGYMKYFSRKKLDEFYYLVREAQKKHTSAIFFDGWKLQGFSDDDFSDVAHLNFNGGSKFSTILNEFIENLEN